MAKRRSCRRTAEEDKFHDIAVRIRRMTDEQLCKHIEALTDEAYDRGYQKGREAVQEVAEEKGNSVKDFIDLISGGTIKGIGCATVSKLIRVAMDNGYIR